MANDLVKKRMEKESARDNDTAENKAALATFHMSYLELLQEQEYSANLKFKCAHVKNLVIMLNFTYKLKILLSVINYINGVIQLFIVKFLHYNFS